MKILLTNDDGIDSPGLKTIYQFLSKLHEVIVVAPSAERSGSSNSLTFHNKVIIKKYDSNHFTCSGTPADCVHRTLHHLIDGFMPDIVVSGINLGPNLGTDIIYSGTAAAARQAAVMGVPGIAVSVTAFQEPFYFDRAAAFVAENIDAFYANWNSEHFININVPSIASGKSEVMVTIPSRRFYKETMDRVIMTEDDTMEVSLDISGISHDDKYGSDCYAVDRGMISISPVFIQPVIDEKSRQLYKSIFNRNSHG